MINVFEAWTNAVVSQMQRTKAFLYIPARDEPRDVDFGEAGRFEKEKELSSWEVYYDGKTKTMSMRIRIGGSLAGTLKLLSTGEWKGRDRRNGTMIFRPSIEIERWQQLASQARFAEEIRVDDSEDGFVYKESLPRQIDWKPFEWNIKERFRDTDSLDAHTAVAIIGFDRPSYFKRTVESLAQNPEILDLPVFVFLDKPERDRQHTMGQQADLVRSLIPHSIIIQRPRTFGCGRNIIDARRQLFDNMNYERLFVFEDDMPVTPDYISLTSRLMDWSDETYSNVGAVQAWNKCEFDAKKKQQYASVVRPTVTNWWGYLMKKDAWDTMKDMVYRYEELFLGGEYRYRPHASIMSWFKLKLRKKAIHEGETCPRDYIFGQQHKRYFADPPTGQDAVTMHLFEAMGWTRLLTVANRGEYIGKSGIHMTPKRWIQHNFDRIRLDSIEGDDVRDEFVLEQDFTVEDEETVSEVAAEFPDFHYIDATEE